MIINNVSIFEIMISSWGQYEVRKWLCVNFETNKTEPSAYLDQPIILQHLIKNDVMMMMILGNHIITNSKKDSFILSVTSTQEIFPHTTHMTL